MNVLIAAISFFALGSIGVWLIYETTHPRYDRRSVFASPVAAAAIRFRESMRCFSIAIGSVLLPAALRAAEAMRKFERSLRDVRVGLETPKR